MLVDFWTYLVLFIYLVLVHSVDNYIIFHFYFEKLKVTENLIMVKSCGDQSQHVIRKQIVSLFLYRRRLQVIFLVILLDLQTEISISSSNPLLTPLWGFSHRWVLCSTDSFGNIINNSYDIFPKSIRKKIGNILDFFRQILYCFTW